MGECGKETPLMGRSGNGEEEDDDDDMVEVCLSVDRFKKKGGV